MAEIPVLATRAAFLLPAAIVIFIAAVPALSSRFLAYGSRLTGGHASKDGELDEPAKTSPSLVSEALDLLASLRVPHSYFAHFYHISVFSLTFWAHQINTFGPAFRIVAGRNPLTRGDATTIPEARLLWTMMLLQSARRLYEETAMKRLQGHVSSSRMFVGHWVMGLIFYTAMSVAVWVEAAPALRAALWPDPSSPHQDRPAVFVVFAPSQIFSSIFGPKHTSWFPPPTFRLLGSVSLFLISSTAQHSVHYHLAGLSRNGAANEHDGPSRYSPPSHPAFSSLGLVCPHYFFECLIYLAFTLSVAPRGGPGFHPTMACAVIFTAANLGITANNTKEWWRKQWGEESVRHKKRMIPFLW